MATTVIIPARNEEVTIGDIVGTFHLHEETIGNVFVGIDAATVDGTERAVWENDGFAVRCKARGKGQVVRETLQWISGRTDFVSQRIILCDADYTGLKYSHISKILRSPVGMSIGVPDYPEMAVPEHVTKAWPQQSGFRCLPWSMIPEDAHGYLLETQLNILAAKHRIRTNILTMDGLKAPFVWPLPKVRLNDLHADRDWGMRNGWL